MIRQIAVSGGTMEIADEGPQISNPPPIVLLHGFTGSRDGWNALRDLLRPSRRVISVDLPGHGGTKFAADPARFTMEATARDLISALDQLAVGRFALAGYSMGGRLALYVALAWRARVERLVLESASAGLEDEVERERRRASDEDLARLLEGAGIEAFVDRWERLPLFESHRALPDEVRDRLRRSRLSCDPAGLAASLRGMGSGSQPWLGGRLAELRMPVAIIVGALDSKFLKIGRELAAKIPEARLWTIPGSGHTPHLERPDEFNRLITEFLAAH